MNYQAQFSERVNLDHLTNNPLDRASEKVKEILNRDFCIDVHTHLFDIKCINKSLFKNNQYYKSISYNFKVQIRY